MTAAFTAARDRRLQLPEVLFIGLGACLVAGLAARSGSHLVTLTASVLLVGYGVAVIMTGPGDRGRVIANYLAAWACYAGSSAVVEALSVPLQHDRLLQWDAALFGVSPAIAVQGLAPPWMNDLLSLGYLSYHVWLHWALLDALARTPDWREGLSRWVFSAFAIGFVGYFLLPAAPPAQAFPQAFTLPITGTWPTAWNAAINDGLAARYDAFPSLHLLVTLTVAVWDWRHLRRRFWIMAGPALLMVGATLVLRFHYAVDLLASLVLFVLLCLVLTRLPSASSPHG